MSDTRNKGTDSNRILELWEQTGGNVAEIARTLGLCRGTVYYFIDRLGLRRGKPLHDGRLAPSEVSELELPSSGVKRYLFTCLQNNTQINDKVWNNLIALKNHWKAELHISRFTYNKQAYGKLSVKPGTDSSNEEDELWFDPRIEPFISDLDLDVAPGLRWCGRMNTLPTAVRPLSGFETHTGPASGIFPHVKIAMRSVPTEKMEPTKFLYTTGTIGKINYVQKRAGLKAEHHHAYGALIVEVTADGTWWARQLHAGPRGEIYDLDVIADKGKVQKATGRTVLAINWGDIHLEKPDDVLREATWKKGGILDELKPVYQFMHDLIDPPRNHHSLKDPHLLFEQFVRSEDSMYDMCDRVSDFLSHESNRPFCQTVVVNSNHDNMIERWLREADYRKDPANAIFFLKYQLAKYEAISRDDKNFMLIEHIMRDIGCAEDNVRFLREDESFVLEKIQFGHHGHLGANGARGSAQGYAKMGRRANRGHDHSASIYDGTYTAGIWGNIDQEYNSGMSSWSPTMIITYRNGRRALVTTVEGRHKA